MQSVFDKFVKKKNFLVCVDSDGCAMDTMNIKHIRCFGPCMVREWELQNWERPILERWNEINLYTATRGINRFVGLSLALTEIDERYKRIDDLASLRDWVSSAAQLSNANLLETCAKNGSPILKKAYDWSLAVNRLIEQLPEDSKVPFAGVRECLSAVHAGCDAAVVSSANLQAVEAEWKTHALAPYADLFLAQDAGSKAFCIGSLLKKGYEPSHVLMVGDAPGDLDAARQNGVLYYPILVKKERESWNRLLTEGLNRFLRGTFAGEYQNGLINEFEENLK